MCKLNMLVHFSGIEQWTEHNGPQSRCGVDYWYTSGAHEAHINDDQGFITITVDGNEIFSGMEDEVAEET